MTDIKNKLIKLGNEIIQINSSGYILENGKTIRLCEYNRTYNKIIETFDDAIKVIKEFKTDSNITDNEKKVLLGLINELLKEYGRRERTTEEKKEYRSYKLDRLASKTTILKSEIRDLNISDVESEEVSNYIKNLKIFKISKEKSMLLDSCYQTTYELYSELKDILLNDNITAFRLLYIQKIIEIIESSEYKEKIYEDYGLNSLLELFKNDDKIKEKMCNIIHKSSIQEKIKGSIFSNKIKMILKNE